MKLTDAKKLFDRLRKDASRIVPTAHSWRDHPDRKFTPSEIVALVQGRGRLALNKMPTATVGSFLWHCKDEAERACELVVKFEPRDGKPNELVLVISAFR